MISGAIAAAGVNKRGRRAVSLQKKYGAVLGFLAHPDQVDPTDLVNSSANDARMLWRLTCNRSTHVRQLQLRSVIAAVQGARAKGQSMAKAMGHAFYCKLCDSPAGAGRSASAHERRCYDRVMAAYPEHELWIESCVLGSSLRTPLDLYMPAAHLGIMVDGEQHFMQAGSAGRGGAGPSSAQEQAARDESMNQCVGSGAGLDCGLKGLLRLHYADSRAVWQSCLARALQLAQDTSVRCFVQFSPGYDRSPWITHM